MVTKVFPGGRLVMLGAAVVFLSAELAHAAPPRIHHPLPHHGGTLLGHFHHPGHHLRQPSRPYYGGYGYYGGFGAYFPSYGYAYGQADGGYSAYYPYYG